MVHDSTSQSLKSVKAQVVRDRVLRRITEGQIKPGDRIPSEADLAREMRMNNRTVRRGLAQLVKEGVIVKQRGVGTFVRLIEQTQVNTSTALLMPEHLFHVQKFSPTGLLYGGARQSLDQSRFNISMLGFRAGHLWEDAGRVAISRGVRGAMVMPTWAESEEHIQRLRDEGMSVVVLDAADWHRIHVGAGGWVGHDRSAIMISLAQGLLARGFERLIVSRGTAILSWTLDEAVFRAIYAKANKPLDLRSAIFEASSPASGLAEMEAAIDASDEKRPRTCIIVPDEIQALDVFRMCYARGLRVPEDIAIAAVMDHAPQLHPIPLTAVDGAKFLAEMAAVAGKELGNLLDGNEGRAGGTILPTPIEWKASTGDSV